MTEDLKIVSETFANELSYFYFTANLSSPSPHQAFCGNLGSVVITYESVCKRLLSLDVEASMGPDGFHPKLLTSYQAVAYLIYLFKKKSFCNVVSCHSSGKNLLSFLCLIKISAIHISTTGQ